MYTLLLLLACDDTLFQPEASEVGTLPDGPSWCAVQSVFETQCLGCHGAATAFGGLDLETDPHGTIVDGASSAGGTLVVAGSAADSVLYQRMTGEGGVMPPSGLLDAAILDTVAEWIDAGATLDCADSTTDTDDPTQTPTDTEDTAPTTGGTRYHPAGWDDPTVHGMAAKFQTETDCRDCHGTELLGGVGPACESCHGVGWETNCLWCHGGVEGTDGAPPEGIDDRTGPQVDTFIPHSTHLESAWANVPCETCHTVPTSALTAGHLFDDDTPGVAEVTFGRVATGGSWAGATCTVYCHGNGRTDGDIQHTAGPRDCGSCHADPDTRADWDQLSGRHEKHLDEGLTCDECHGPVVDSTMTIIDSSLHIDGVPTYDMPVTFTGGQCSGTCHGEGHSARTW